MTAAARKAVVDLLTAHPAPTPGQVEAALDRYAAAVANAESASCSCGSPDAYSLSAGEVVVHRQDGPCYFAAESTTSPGADSGDRDLNDKLANSSDESTARAALSLLLRRAARSHLGLSDGDYWPSGVADAQADALLAEPTPAAPPAAGVVDRAGEALAAHRGDVFLTPRDGVAEKGWYCRCKQRIAGDVSWSAAHLASHQAEALAAVGLLAGGADAVAALADEWQRDLDSGGIRDAEARYCWSTALRELRAVLATHAEDAAPAGGVDTIAAVIRSHRADEHGCCIAGCGWIDGDNADHQAAALAARAGGTGDDGTGAA